MGVVLCQRAPRLMKRKVSVTNRKAPLTQFVSGAGYFARLFVAVSPETAQCAVQAVGGRRHSDEGRPACTGLSRSAASAACRLTHKHIGSMRRSTAHGHGFLQSYIISFIIELNRLPAVHQALNLNGRKSRIGKCKPIHPSTNNVVSRAPREHYSKKGGILFNEAIYE